MSRPFQTVHHFCIVVADIKAAVRFYESIGIGPWRNFPPLTQYTALEVPDRAAFLDLTYMYTELGELQIQLVQPGAGDSPQGRFLRRTGGGVFHIGFSVDDVVRATDCVAEFGFLPWMKGRHPSGAAFAYFDTASAAGVTLEVRQGPTAR